MSLSPLPVPSPSDVRQLFGKLGWHRGSATEFAVTGAYANNSLTGNALQTATAVREKILDGVRRTVKAVTDMAGAPPADLKLTSGGKIAQLDMSAM